MGNQTIETLFMHDGTALRVARFEPDGLPCGVIQILHGFGEHIGHYESVAAHFTARSFVCILHEQRGFGEMPGKTLRERKKSQGITPGYWHFLKDVDTVRDQIDIWYPGVPVSLYGFSMGGNIGLNYLLRFGQGRHVRVVLESPWLRLCKPIPVAWSMLVCLLGNLSRHIRASVRMRHPLGRDALCDDALFHGRLSMRLYGEITGAGEYAIQNAGRITVPTLLFSAGCDQIVCANAIQVFAEDANDNIVIRAYSDGFHCLHAGKSGASLLDEVSEFCKTEKDH